MRSVSHQLQAINSVREEHGEEAAMVMMKELQKGTDIEMAAEVSKPRYNSGAGQQLKRIAETGDAQHFWVGSTFLGPHEPLSKRCSLFNDPLAVKEPSSEDSPCPGKSDDCTGEGVEMLSGTKNSRNARPKAKKMEAKKWWDSSDDEESSGKRKRRGPIVSENPVLDKAVDLHLDNRQDDDKNEMVYGLSLAGKERSKCQHCNRNIAENRWRVGRLKKCHGAVTTGGASSWWHSSCFLKAYCPADMTSQSSDEQLVKLIRSLNSPGGRWSFLEQSWLHNALKPTKRKCPFAKPTKKDISKTCYADAMTQYLANKRQRETKENDMKN
jgi:hypothetical protein